MKDGLSEWDLKASSEARENTQALNDALRILRSGYKPKPAPKRSKKK